MTAHERIRRFSLRRPPDTELPGPLDLPGSVMLYGWTARELLGHGSLAANLKFSVEEPGYDSEYKESEQARVPFNWSAGMHQHCCRVP